ncbi:amino acid transporter AVT1E isoform X2 [Jatropha curcas]|uniref:amino acid transporter AVT1E isoform X2 n=1 Tax=Jatropha curcas TaxID=180498 RepID=UPI0009D6ECF2|nr:amino acid transporter AVT1E isoform X2 [Jatropha curcas]
MKSMDMLGSVPPPSIWSFKGTIVADMTSSITSICKRRQNSEFSPFLSKPFVSHHSLEREEVPTSTWPIKFSASSRSRFSIGELPQSNKDSSFAQAVLNGINVLCGIGLLTTPYAIKEGGWLSLLVLLLFGILCCYTGTLLKKCLESSPGLRTYPDIGQAAFGLSGRLAISIMLYVELYAACVEYIIMISDNLSRLFPNTFINFAGTHLGSHQIFALTATVIVLPTVWLRDLSLLSYLSVGGVGASILVAFCLLWVGVVDKVGFHHNGTALNLAKLPFAIGIYGYGFSGHAVFPNIYTSMKEPSSFTSVLIVSFIFCWFMYTAVAICGFLMFGNSIKSQYTLNMPVELMASKIAVWTAVVNPITKYALTLTPVALSLEELMPPGRLRSYSISLIIRTVLVISTLVVAVAFPFFGFVMAFIGSSLAMVVAVIFPCICYLRILHERLNKLQIAACIFTITVGVLTACFGTYSSIARLANNVMEGK